MALGVELRLAGAVAVGEAVTVGVGVAVGGVPVAGAVGASAPTSTDGAASGVVVGLPSGR